MNKHILVLTIAFLMTAPFAYARGNRHQPTPPPPPTPIATTSIMWGSYSGNTDASMASFEQYVGVRENIDAVFVGATDGAFPGSIAGSQGKTLLLFWEPQYGYSTLLNGSQDKVISQFAASLKSYGYPVILAPMAEFNLGDAADCQGAPWGVGCGTNTVAGFIAAWQHLRALFAGISNVKFALDYNDGSVPAMAYSAFYPGDAYVDYVGIDGFNFGGDTYANDIGNDISSLQAFGKPVWVLSTGSVQPQTAFIQALGAQKGIAGWVWFNQSPFNITGASLSAFKGII